MLARGSISIANSLGRTKAVHYYLAAMWVACCCPRSAVNGPDFVEHYCTCSVVFVERTSEPVAGDEVPVTVMVYGPAGVPKLPVILLLPPHAT